MSINKKAISPLISWILLIGFAVAMGTIITNWSIEQVQKVKFEKETVREYCNDVDIEISAACRNPAGDQIRVKVKNEGYFDLPYATIGRSTPNIPESWCLDLDFNSLSGTNNILIKGYKINGTFLNSSFDSDFNQVVQCEQLTGGVVNETLYSLTIVPWIDLQGQSIPCTNKKIVISEENLCNCNQSLPPDQLECT